MKQKLGLACTLVRPPRLLLLDEPTVGVDPVSRRELWPIVDRLVAAKGMSVLLSTAYLDEAERCDEVILLHDGRVLEHGPPAATSARAWPAAPFSCQRAGRAAARRARRARWPARASSTPSIQGERVRLVTAEPAPPERDMPCPGRHGVASSRCRRASRTALSRC